MSKMTVHRFERQSFVVAMIIVMAMIYLISIMFCQKINERNAVIFLLVFLVMQNKRGRLQYFSECCIGNQKNKEKEYSRKLFHNCKINKKILL